MKILIVITRGNSGGAQMSVLNLAKALNNRGHQVLVALGDGNFLAEELEKGKIPYYRFKNLKRTLNPLANLFFIFEIKKFLRGKDFNVVHFNSSNALFGALGVKLFSKKIKTVFTFRGMSVLDDNHEMNFLFKKLYFYFFKTFLKFIDRPVFVSRQNLAKAQEMHLVKNGKVVYNGLDFNSLQFTNKEDARKYFSELGINSEDKYLIGSIGRLVYVKNYEFLISIFSKVLEVRPDACLLIIGEGPKRKHYLNMIKNLGLEDKIFFVGEIKNAYRFIKAFDLFVLPSRYEGLSITLIESLMAGVPALVSNVGGNEEVLRNDNEIYELDNQKDFLDKLQDLQQASTVSEIIQNKHEQALKFDIKNTADAYEKVYLDSNLI